MAFVYPKSFEDEDGILQYAKDVAQANQSFWSAIELQAQENILMFVGGQLQWATYSNAIKSWRPLGLKKGTPQRPVTNKVKPLVNDLASKLVAFKPPITWSPGSNQDADYVAASVADRVNVAIERETDQKAHKPIAARWLATTGNVFVVSSYDNSPETGTTFIQAHRCQHCGNTVMPADVVTEDGQTLPCPHCGSIEVASIPDPMTGMMLQQPMQSPKFEAAIDGNGVPVGVDYPRGRHMIELENVFTVRFDPQVDRFHKTPYLRIARTRDKAWVAEHYGEEFAESVSYNRYADPLSSTYESLAFAAFGGGGTYGMGDTGQERALVERLWIRPNPSKAPGGIYAEIVGDKVALARDYPYHDERGRPMLNVAHLEFDQVPGRALASTRCDDITPLQREVNTLDYFISLHHKRMANAVWTLPRGSDISRTSGEPGIYIHYNPLSTGHRPQREQGVMIPQDIYQYREIRKREMDEIWGSYEVSRGEAPKGVSAYAAMQLLDERASQGQSNIMANWALGWMEVARQQMNIFREYADEDRTISLGVGRWATKTFNRASFEGGADMDVDVGPGRPMTMVAKMARIGQAITEGVLNMMDPQVQYLVLRAMGLQELMPDYNVDYEAAGRVVDKIVQAQTPADLPPEPNPFDNHAVQLAVISRFVKDEAFDELQDWQQNALILRAQMHYTAMQEAVQQAGFRAGQNAPRLGAGKPSGGGGGGPQSEEEVLDAERQGASSDVNQGVTAGNNTDDNG